MILRVLSIGAGAAKAHLLTKRTFFVSWFPLEHTVVKVQDLETRASLG